MSSSSASASSPRTRLHRRWAGLLLLVPVVALADDIPFDRPGIPFATETLKAGGFAWEQGLPDITLDRSDGTTQRQYVADTVLRLGLTDAVELQLASDTQVSEHDTGAARFTGHGAGDSTLGLKIALPSQREAFSWALLLNAQVARGRSPYGSDAHTRSLGLSTQWALADQRALTLFAEAVDSDEGHSWTFAPNLTVIKRESWQAYVEAGIGHGQDSTQGVGGGIAWSLGDHAQLDVSLLRGTTSDAADWQGGLGVSIGFQ
ncbi:Putative MetA-pathway of phenol degradation [Pseudoxanthomonas sp. GM95]|uniref:transporter n=1 Tax=Pseudoxanthomonas sp. GM95 TaxID=1881043 RepID=UPI0008BAC182|nr:transporter [Pseudoxanthomonas sp. GM95]SEL58778.1 Putative MetA-pathway of phenol degradation [Pseudoxanthomonas sp. GM95]